MAELVFEIWWSDPEYYECETCGPSDDSVEYEEYGDGSFSLRFNLGCYSGAGEYEDFDRALTLVDYYDFVPKKIRNKIRARLTRLQGETA